MGGVVTRQPALWGAPAAREPRMTNMVDVGGCAGGSLVLCTRAIVLAAGESVRRVRTR